MRMRVKKWRMHKYVAVLKIKKWVDVQNMITLNK